MKYFVHIKSIIPSKISINGEKLLESHVDIISSRDFYIAFFPDSQERYLPCATSFFGDLRPLSIKKIPFNNNHYDIIYNPAVVPSQNETIVLNKKYNNTIFSITNSHKSFISITNTNYNHNSSTHLLRSINFKSSEGYVIISGKINNTDTYLLIFNTKKNHIVIEDIFNKVETTKSSIKVLKDEKTISGYGKVYEFNFSTKKLSNYSVVISSKDLNLESELIPLAFLESIQHSDFKSAKLYLLNNNISNEHLKNYFGEIKEVYFNGYSKEINYTIFSDKYRNYTFSVEDNKIVEIEENQLNLV